MAIKAITTAVVGTFMLSACATLTDTHGYIPDDALLDELIVGLDTQETTARLLGRPGAEGIIDARGWYYVKSDYEQFLWRAPVEVDREVVAVTFGETGIVENIERFGLEDGQVVVLSRRVTDANTQGISLLRQLFSNLGNFTTDQFLGQ